MLIILCVSVVLVLLAITLIYWLAPTEELRTTGNREQAIYFNEMWYQEYKAALSNPDLSLSEKAFLMRELQRYEFFLRTNTIHTDYLQFSYNECKFEGYEGIGFLFSILSFGLFAYAVYAMFCALYMISEEKREGSLKNLFASNIPKDKLFLSKLAIYGALLIIPYIIFAIIIGIAGIFVPHGSFLVYTTHFEAVSGYAILWQMIFTDFVIGIMFFAVTVLLSVFLRQIPCIALTVSGYLLLGLLMYVIHTKIQFLPFGGKVIPTSIFVPIVGFQSYGEEGMVLNSIYFIFFAVSIAIAAILLIISAKQFNKRNI
ncbi:MAG: ABC transporter permease subunit [Clostridiales bacterium]|nr:ABC transporter permease subunit [Clostridiales bacterium]